MPMLDVSVALTNPYTLDTFNVLRRAEVINGFGESIQGVVQFNGVFGVVYPEGDESLDRRPDVQLQGKELVVITMFGLRAAAVDGQGQSWQPDLIVWHGNNYLCADLSDYSNYALGFTKVRATILDSTETPPVVANFSAFGGKVLSYALTQISPTQFSLPVSPSVSNLQLFRNGVLLQSPSDFTLSGNIITLTTPLGSTDTLVAYA